VCDRVGRALGLVWSSTESLRRSLATGRAHFTSRTRGAWEKGATSGDRLSVVRFEADCDRDALRLVAEPLRDDGAPANFCHLARHDCFGSASGLAGLERTLRERRRAAPAGSYSARLFADPGLLADKLAEEARELGAEDARAGAVREAADLFYFALAKLVASGASLADVEDELERRSRAVTRRGGASKGAADGAASARALPSGAAGACADEEGVR
jgi:phosphoribosyl-ATP pyrophosphohydrolase/phosphoribosyl-AMP cyclohydrolase/histidinol dehydrogenase